QPKTTGKTVSGNFTNREDLKNRFFSETSGSHNLDEDIDDLANFFNGLAKVDDDINEIKLAANETIFNQKKQALTSKIQQLLSKCRVTSATSYLDRFSTKLTNQLNSIEKLEPKHQQELLQLEDDLRKAESKYNENLAKYNNPNTSPTEKTKLMLLVNEALDDIKRIKGKLKHNPLANLERYNYLDDLERLFAGNAPEPTNNPRGGREPGGSGSGGNGNGQTPNPLEDPKSFFTQNKTMLVFVLGLVGLALYLFIQKDDEEDEDIKENKKFMRQMAMMKMMNEKNNSPNEK
ncbi:5151_t:CDS:2, partial [Cetraspora pellucida]